MAGTPANTQTSAPQQILDAIGGAENITSFTHCATRLRFELADASVVDTPKVEAIPGVMGAVSQSGDRYQIIIGGGVADMYHKINQLPEMSAQAASGSAASAGKLSDADVKAAARAKTRGKVAWVDNFFEYLSDSFRPILGVLLASSLIIAFAAMMEAFGVQAFNGVDEKPGGWVFIDAMWRSVLYFLPIMVAYNAAKKLNADPWLGATIMAAVMTPNFIALSGNYDTTCVTNETLGTESCVANIFGLPMQLNDYGGQVFVPLIMCALLGLLYKGLKRIIPENVQMVFVPFIAMIVMIPLTGFFIGPLSIWIGSGIGTGLAWLNTSAPIVFAILIPLIYPFLVPLGLHWPLNALMLVNINTLGYDFIQGPMGAWNFACFGATAGVLFISIRERDTLMRQTATGALAAGLLGGISEPSLYGIHLRYKRIYPRMLVGCLVGGVLIGVLGAASGGVKTGAFAFTSLLTIPVFSPMITYIIAIAASFTTSMVLVIIFDYRTAQQRADFRAQRDAQAAEQNAVTTEASATNTDSTTATETPTIELLAPLAGTVISLDDAGDPVFASRALGEGVAVQPDAAADAGTLATVNAPVSGTVTTVQKSGHAYGIKSATGVEVLVHIGIDTVELKGEGFQPQVTKGQQITAGAPLAQVDFAKIKAAGYPTATIVVVTNTKALAAVTAHVGEHAEASTPVITVTK